MQFRYLHCRGLLFCEIEMKRDSYFAGGLQEALKTEIAEDLQNLQQSFEKRVAELKDYLAPILSQIHLVHQRPSTTASTSTVNKKGAAAGDAAPAAATHQAADSQEYLVLLMDTFFTEFAMEALPQIYNNDVFASITRDFSAQVKFCCYHRCCCCCCCI